MTTRLEGEGAYSAAADAWRIVDFPLVERDADSNYVDISDDPNHGAEGLLPAELFKPTAYDISKNCSQAWSNLIDAPGVHGEAALKVNLGEYGDYAIPGILGEMLFVARNRHKATIALTAMNVRLGRITGQPSETVVSMWNNGRPYDSAEALEDGFMHDWTRTLARPADEMVAPRLIENTADATPTVIVTTATAVLKGVLSVYGRENGIHITHADDERSPTFSFKHFTTPGILGNLVVARLPHLTPGASEAVY